LTQERHKATVARLQEVSSMLSYAEWYLRKCGAPEEWLDDLPEQIRRFHALYNSRVGVRQPSDLRVLYLCGPEPNNDLDVLFNLGCIPENIWGVEQDKTLFGRAVAQLTTTGTPIKVHRGGLKAMP
jgi:hypothetical protein